MKTSKTKNSNKIKKKKKNFHFIKKLLIFILIALLALAVWFTYKVIKNGGGKQGILMTAMGQTKEEIENLDPISVLLLGSSQNLSDTIIIFKYNPKTQKAYLVSIPRDTFTGNSKASATAFNKINSLYQGKYPEKTLAAVNKLTNLNLKYYAVVDTEALKSLVDTIGGVYFDVPIDMKYTDASQELYINLNSGYQLLDGNKAEQVVRFRHNQDGTSYPAEYGDNDIGRMKTQRNFLKAIMEQTLTPSNLLNIGKFIDIAQNYVKTNIPIDVVKKYAAPAVEFNTENLETDTLPGAPEKCNNIWFFIANTSKISTFFNQLNNKISSSFEISKEELTNVNIELLNGTGKSTNLTSIKKLLTDAGFTISNTKNINSTTKTSIINKSDVSENILEYLQSIIGTGTISKSDSKSETVNITIILGSDLNE